MPLCHSLRLPLGFVLKRDKIFGQLGDRHVFRANLGDDPPAIKHDHPIGDLVHIFGEIVLDVDAGAAGSS